MELSNLYEWYDSGVCDEYVRDRVKESLDLYNDMSVESYTLRKKWEEIQRLKGKFSHKELERVKSKIWVSSHIDDYKNQTLKSII